MRAFAAVIRTCLVPPLLTGCLFAAVPASADPTAVALAPVDIKMADAVQNGFGGAILIEQKGKPVFAKGYGFADREKKIPFTLDTVAQIGSITKAMTAFAVLELAQEGKLDLEKPVKTYLPDAADPAGSATLHQILTHHAGLMDVCGDDSDRLSKVELQRKCMAMPLAFPPGTDHYSNMDYSILAAVVEQVSGESWETYLREHIWQPLGMRRTGYLRFDGLKPGDFAQGYLNDKSQGVITDRLAALQGEDWNLHGNGGIQASTMDMERFYRGLTGKLPGISRDVASAMMTPHEPMGGEAWEGYGLFVRLDAHDKPYRIGFSGSDGTFFSYFGMLPQQDVFFYVVGNNGEPNVKPVVGTVLHAALAIAGITPGMLQPIPEKK
jgi:CubicO group peptidase (beta-lactamase class C family)